MKQLSLGKNRAAQAMTEYVLIIGAFLGCVAIASGPVPIFPTLINAFQTYLDSMQMVITLPIP